MTKTEFNAACKLLNGFEIVEGNYYKLSSGEVVLVKKMFRKTLRYESRIKHDLIINYYHEFIGNIEKSNFSDFTFVTYPFLDQITRRYQNENYTWLLDAVGIKGGGNENDGNENHVWTYPDGTKLH